MIQAYLRPPLVHQLQLPVLGGVGGGRPAGDIDDSPPMLGQRRRHGPWIRSPSDTGAPSESKSASMTKPCASRLFHDLTRGSYPDELTGAQITLYPSPMVARRCFQTP